MQSESGRLLQDAECVYTSDNYWRCPWKEQRTTGEVQSIQITTVGASCCPLCCLELCHGSKISSAIAILCHIVVIRPPVYHYTHICTDIHSGGSDEAMRWMKYLEICVATSYPHSSSCMFVSLSFYHTVEWGCSLYVKSQTGHATTVMVYW